MVSEWLFFSLLEILNIFFPWFIFIFGREGCHLTVYIWDLCFLLFIFLHTWVFHVLFCSRAEFIKERIFSSLRHGEEAPSKRDVASCDPSPAVEVVITLTGSGCHHNNRHPFKTHTHTIHNPAFFSSLYCFNKVAVCCCFCADAEVFASMLICGREVWSFWLPWKGTKTASAHLLQSQPKISACVPPVKLGLCHGESILFTPAIVLY